MWLYDVHKKERGFTLTEMLVTVIVAGILAAITTPSMVGMFNNSKVKSALEELNGALTEAQRQAMRRGKSCTVSIDTTHNQITVATGTGSEGCLLSDRTFPDELKMTTNISGNQVKFSFRGNTTLSDQGTIVITTQNGSGDQRCLVVSNALGAIKTGIYNGNATSPTAANCNTPN